MARPPKAPTEQSRIAMFARDELDILVDILRQRAAAAAAPAPTAPDVLGALVLAARQLPPEVVEALVPAYEERQRDELA